jgi:hypothetical protein
VEASTGVTVVSSTEQAANTAAHARLVRFQIDDQGTTRQ